MKDVKACPINNTFQIVGKKFSILILRNMLLYKQTRFNEFLESVEGINSRTLSLRLRQLEHSGLIKRQVIPEIPIKIKYSLTQKGKALMPILEQMGEFSTQQCPGDVFKDSKARPFKTVMTAISDSLDDTN
ncbi:MAG: helix-turn-helix transcriptional regulator [Thaumarchaeota archaeon]|nr:helix-turn-helix transcriptional regulator [Nitrososphaerota archaeon]